VETRVWAAIIVASFGYGTTGVATRAALNAGVPPIALAAIRALLAAVVLAALFAWRRGRIEFSRGNVVTGIMAGLFQLTLPFILFTLAYQYASAGFVGLFVALLPLGVALMAHVMLSDEPLTRAKVAGLLLAFLGVALLLASGDSGLGTAGDPLLAALLTMGAVASLAFAAVFIRSRAGTYQPGQISLIQFVFGTVIVGIIMFVFEGAPPRLTTWGWVLMLYLTLFCSLAPTFLYFWLLSKVTSTKTALTGYLSPLISLVAGVLLLGEVIELGIVIGGALILAGVIWTDQAERRLARAARAG